MDKNIFISFLILFLSFQSLNSQIKGNEVYKFVESSVLLIRTCDQNGMVSHGTGIAINDFGLILTNHHVVYKKEKIELSYNGINYNLKNILFIDSMKDICIFDIDMNEDTYDYEENGIPYLILYNKYAELGSVAYAIGYSGDSTQPQFTAGYILSKYIENGIKYLIFTCPTGQGGSGGALVDDDGEIIGIVTQINTEDPNFTKYIAVSIEELTELGTYESYPSNSSIFHFKIGVMQPDWGGLGYFFEFGLAPKRYYVEDFASWLYNSFYLCSYNRNFNEVFGFHLDDGVTTEPIKYYEAGINYGLSLRSFRSGEFWRHLNIPIYLGFGVTSITLPSYYSLNNSSIKPEENEVNFTVTLGTAIDFYIYDNLGIGFGVEGKHHLGRNRILGMNIEVLLKTRILYCY